MGKPHKAGKVANAVMEAWRTSSERAALIQERDDLAKHVARVNAVAQRLAAERDAAKAERDASKAQLMQDQSVLGATLQEVKALRAEVKALRPPASPPSVPPATTNPKESTP